MNVEKTPMESVDTDIILSSLGGMDDEDFDILPALQDACRRIGTKLAETHLEV